MSIPTSAAGSRLLLDTLKDAAEPSWSSLRLVWVDAELAGCETDQERLRFLNGQLEKFNYGYARLVSRNGGDTDPTTPEPDASDFLLTLLGVSVRRAQVLARLRAERNIA